MPLGTFHLRIGIASTGGVFADGFGLGIIGISLSLATPQLGLSAVWLGVLGGASLTGLFAGALLTGPVADQLGRRTIFAYNMVIAAALSAMQFIVEHGHGIPTAAACHRVPPRDRLRGQQDAVERIRAAPMAGASLGLLAVAWAGGYACAYAVGFFLVALGPESWRWMLLASAAPCLLIAPLRITMPESPLWLANHGYCERAATVVHGKFGRGIRPPAQTPVAMVPAGRWAQLFSVRWRTRTFVACTFFACQVMPYFAVGTFVTEVMSALHLKGGFLGGLIYNFALFAGAITGLLIVDRISRRSFLIGSFVAAAISMLILSATRNLAPVAMILLFAVFAGVISAASNLVYVYLPELFPTDLRASGIGLAIAASRIGSAASTFVLPVLVAAYGVRTALGACVAVLAVGAGVCYRWAPETRRLSLEALDCVAASAQ